MRNRRSGSFLFALNLDRRVIVRSRRYMAEILPIRGKTLSNCVSIAYEKDSSVLDKIQYGVHVQYLKSIPLKW